MDLFVNSFIHVGSLLSVNTVNCRNTTVRPNTLTIIFREKTESIRTKNKRQSPTKGRLLTIQAKKRGDDTQRIVVFNRTEQNMIFIST